MMPLCHMEKILNVENEEDDNNLKKKESTKKGSIQTDESHFRRNSVAPEGRRISSAHCIGQRKETLPEDGNIFDLFRTKGEEVKKEEPQILKYVGEKPEIRPEHSETSFVSGWYEGLCQFCGKQLLEIPTLEQIQDPTLSSQIVCFLSFMFLYLFLSSFL